MKETRQIVLLGAVLVLAAILLPFMTQRDWAVASTGAGAVQEYAADADAVTDVPDSGEEAAMPGVSLQPAAGGAEVFVSLWRDQTEETPVFYLFLPAGAGQLSARWNLRDATRLFLAGEEIKTGDALEHAEGTQVFYMMYRGTPYQGELRILRSANVDAMFLDLTKGDTAWLHADKAHATPADVLLLSPDGSVQYEGVAERVRCRGNVSFEDTQKKTYAVKLAKKADLLDGGRAKRYVLLANAFDRSLIRNWTADYLAAETQVPFAVRNRHVDLYLNGDYAGNYLLCEQIEIQENRIGIRDMEKEMKYLNPDPAPESRESFSVVEGRLIAMRGVLLPNEPQDISGGYLVEMEMSDRWYLEAKSGFITHEKQAYTIQSPEEASPAQVRYIAGLVQDMEDAVNAPDGIHPETGKHFTEYLDMESFARHYIIEELTKNLDSASTSQFFYKPHDRVSTRLFAGPTWDHDKSLGIYGGQGESLEYEGYALGEPEGLFAGAERSVYNLWHALYRHAEFRKQVAGIYRDDTYSAACFLADKGIAEMADFLQDSAAMESVRWYENGPLSARNEAEKVASFLRLRADWLLREWEEEQDKP